MSPHNLHMLEDEGVIIVRRSDAAESSCCFADETDRAQSFPHAIRSWDVDNWERALELDAGPEIRRQAFLQGP